MRHVIYIGTPTERSGNQQQGGESFSWQAPDREVLKREYKEKLANKGRELWRDLFTQISTLDQLSAWENEIPAFECNCKRFYLSWKANNQPAEVNGEIPFEWKWALKSAVNQKLGHADLTLEEARIFWESEIASSRL